MKPIHPIICYETHPSNHNSKNSMLFHSIHQLSLLFYSIMYNERTFYSAVHQSCTLYLSIYLSIYLFGGSIREWALGDYTVDECLVHMQLRPARPRVTRCCRGGQDLRIDSMTGSSDSSDRVRGVDAWCSSYYNEMQFNTIVVYNTSWHTDISVADVIRALNILHRFLLDAMDCILSSCTSLSSFFVGSLWARCPTAVRCSGDSLRILLLSTSCSCSL